MLVIKKEQIKALEQSKKDSFVKKANGFLRFKYPEKTEQLTDARLDEIINNAIDRTKIYDIKSERGIIAFLEFMFSLSFDFDSALKTLWTRDILVDGKLNESEKVMAIINKLKA